MYGRLLTSAELRQAIGFAKQKGFTVTETKSNGRIRFSKAVTIGQDRVEVEGLYLKYQYAGEVNIFWNESEKFTDTLSSGEVLAKLLKEVTAVAKKFYKTSSTSR